MSKQPKSISESIIYLNQKLNSFIEVVNQRLEIIETRLNIPLKDTHQIPTIKEAILSPSADPLLTVKKEAQ